MSDTVMFLPVPNRHCFCVELMWDPILALHIIVSVDTYVFVLLF